MRTDQILMLLKTNGPMTAPEVANKLKMTSEGARLQLAQLTKEGIVQSDKIAQGVGRPRQYYTLSDNAQAYFPDTHADLTLQMINHLRSTLGEQALDKVIDAREKEIQDRYLKELAPIPSVEEKIEQLARIRSREGYLADVRKEDEGYLLVENHCPICEAARHCQGFCRSELNTFRQILGEEVHIERVEHIVKGARRCAYRIIPSNQLS